MCPSLSTAYPCQIKSSFLILLAIQCQCCTRKENRVADKFFYSQTQTSCKVRQHIIKLPFHFLTEGLWKCRHCDWTHRLSGPCTVDILDHQGHCIIASNLDSLVHNKPLYYSPHRGQSRMLTNVGWVLYYLAISFSNFLFMSSSVRLHFFSCPVLFSQGLTAQNGISTYEKQKSSFSMFQLVLTSLL